MELFYFNYQNDRMQSPLDRYIFIHFNTQTHWIAMIIFYLLLRFLCFVVPVHSEPYVENISYPFSVLYKWFSICLRTICECRVYIRNRASHQHIFATFVYPQNFFCYNWSDWLSLTHQTKKKINFRLTEWAIIRIVVVFCSSPVLVVVVELCLNKRFLFSLASPRLHFECVCVLLGFWFHLQATNNQHCHFVFYTSIYAPQKKN